MCFYSFFSNKSVKFYDSSSKHEISRIRLKCPKERLVLAPPGYCRLGSDLFQVCSIGELRIKEQQLLREGVFVAMGEVQESKSSSKKILKPLLGQIKAILGLRTHCLKCWPSP